MRDLFVPQGAQATGHSLKDIEPPAPPRPAQLMSQTQAAADTRRGKWH